MPSDQLRNRAFPAPSPILPKGDAEASFDVVFMADFSNKAHQIETTIEIVSNACRDHRRVGIFHWRDYENVLDGEFHPAVCALLDDQSIEQISAFQEARAETVVLCDPFLARYPIEGLPALAPSRVEVMCDYAGSLDVTLDPRRRRMPTDTELNDLFGQPCHWTPIRRNEATKPFDVELM